MVQAEKVQEFGIPGTADDVRWVDILDVVDTLHYRNYWEQSVSAVVVIFPNIKQQNDNAK